MQTHKHPRRSVWIFGIFLLAIALNYSQIFTVYHQSKSSSQNNNGSDLEDYDQPSRTTVFTNPNPHHTNAGAVAAGQTNNLVADTGNTFGETTDTTTETTTETATETAKDTAKSAEIEKKAKRRQSYLEKHLEMKRQFVADQLQNATRTTIAEKESAQARAQRIFVDLEKDPPPKDNSYDPWFVLHIGPPKTATTSIQCGLEKHSLRLAKTDGYHYLGGGCGMDGFEYYMPNGEATVLRFHVYSAMTTNGWKSALPRDHYDRFVERSAFLRRKGRSVVLSSELFGSRLPSSESVMNKMRNALVGTEPTGAGFSPERVRIVLAYRHFVDWLPSFHYQENSYNSHDKPFAKRDADPEESRVQPFLQFAERYLSNWEGHQEREQLKKKSSTPNDSDEPEGSEGAHKEEEDGDDDDDDRDPLFASLGLPEDRQSTHPSWWLYKLWSTYFPLPNQVQVYDMHSPMNSNRPNDDTVTNFVCNMLPDAGNTCSKLMLLEDERIKSEQREPNEEASNGTHVAAENERNPYREYPNADEPDYENPRFHHKSSFLWQKPPDDHKVRKGRLDTSSGSVRTSTDLDAVMIVEELLIRGEIPPFNYSAYGKRFFEQERHPNETEPEFHNGYTKKELIEIAQQLLDEHNIRAPDEKYFDCMSSDLEGRLLKASLTFVDLIYKQTQMLSLAANVSTLSAGASGENNDNNNNNNNSARAFEDEREKRFSQALAEHARLFEKNKARGKYCDISPSKVFREVPAIWETMASLSFKPQYKKFQYSMLPDHALPHIRILGLEDTWERAKVRKMKRWKELSPEKKAAAFYLGWSPSEQKRSRTETTQQ